ncbi:alpha-1,3-arabinosyltransferase XAT2-like [Rutidosis leptorrhynchoides]|uniref:alpha-1,3-arabinosyltransferase XAT2-like n=1 Tax=Rutidosis leptorrhynchoides TaxID=125765 RepID=UPI003A990DC6
MHRRVLCGATQTVCLLTFIYLFYTQSFGFDPIKLWFGTRNFVNVIATEDEVVEFEGNLRPCFKSLIGDSDQQMLETTKFACNSAPDSLVCVTSNLVKINTKSLNIYMPTRINSSNHSTYFSVTKDPKVVQVRPYAWRQFDVLKNITPINFYHEPPQTPTRFCDHNHSIPTIILSLGGFTGNLFHEFNEIVIPLYITSRLFESQVQFIIVDYNPSFVKKYKQIFSSLSHYDVLDPTINASIHCFGGAVVGLKFHNFLSINTSEVPKGNSMIEFRKFLQITYGLTATNVSDTKSSSPVLILISRRKTRLFLNEDEMVDMMEELGFDVVVVRSNKKMSNLDKFSKLVSTCSVLVGAHGAGLTNLVFLPGQAVVVQVVPLGLEWPSTVYFGEPAVGMGLHYLDYKIGPDESSLSDLYGPNDPVILNPGSVFAKGYYVGKEMYLDKQNIKVDVNRFKGTLIEALRLIGRTNPLST